MAGKNPFTSGASDVSPFLRALSYVPGLDLIAAPIAHFQAAEAQNEHVKNFQDAIAKQLQAGVAPQRALLSVMQQNPDLLTHLPQDVFSNVGSLVKILQPHLNDVAPGHHLLTDTGTEVASVPATAPDAVRTAQFLFPNDEKAQKQYVTAQTAKAPATRTIKIGDKDVAQQFDPVSGKWFDVATGDAFAPPEIIRKAKIAFPNDPKKQQEAVQDSLRMKNLVGDLIQLRDRAAAAGKTKDVKTYQEAIDNAVKTTGILGLLKGLGALPGQPGPTSDNSGTDNTADTLANVLAPPAEASPANSGQSVSVPIPPVQQINLKVLPGANREAQIISYAQLAASTGHPITFLDADGTQKVIQPDAAKAWLQKHGTTGAK